MVAFDYRILIKPAIRCQERLRVVATDRPNIKNEASRRQSDSQTTEGQRMWWSILPASWGRAGDRHHSTGFCYAPKTRYDSE